MKKRIAVLGAGGTGQTAAADLTLAGCQVTLFENEKFSKSLDAVSEVGGVTIEGAGRTGFAKIHKITTNIEEAIKDAEIIIVAVIAERHAEIAEICAPYLKDGQIILISPGNAGSIIFDNMLKDKGIKKDVVIAELEGNLHPCRIIGPAKVIVAFPTKSKYVAAFPAKDTARVIEGLKGIYNLVPATNAFEAALNTPNVVVHLGASLLNIGAIDKSGGEYYLYSDGITPSIMTCAEALEAEKIALFKALGYVDRTPLDLIRKVAIKDEFPELDIFRGLIGPTSADHRYITEDAGTCVSLIISLGEITGVPVPLSRAMVAIASAINQEDYLGNGRTLKNLGLDGFTADELNRYLAEGR